MNYPQYQQGYQQPQQFQQPQYGAPAPQQAYAPQAQPQQPYLPPTATQVPQPQYQQAPQGYAPQPQPQFQPSAQAQASWPTAPSAPEPMVRGSLADAYNQGASSGGYGNSAKTANAWPVPGAKFGGYLARDILDTDVTPETDFATKAIKRRPDQSVRWQIKLAVNVPASPAFPEGKATIYVKTSMLSAFIRAAVAAGYDEKMRLREGDYVEFTRGNDVNVGKGNPMHDFDALVIPAGGQVPAQVAPVAPVAPAPQFAQAPVQQYAPASHMLQHPEQYEVAPNPAVAMATGLPMAQPQQFAPAQVPQPQFQAPVAPAPAPAPAPAGAPGSPFAGLDIQSAAVVATLTGTPLTPDLAAQLPQLAQSAPDAYGQYMARFGQQAA